MPIQKRYIDNIQKFSDRAALEIADDVWTYEQLGNKAYSIHQKINEVCQAEESLVALFSYRSITAFAGILGIHLAGKGYVPLNPYFPNERNIKILNRSACTTLIIGSECAQKLPEILNHFPNKLTIICPDIDLETLEHWQNQFNQYMFIHIFDFNVDRKVDWDAFNPTEPGPYAYVLFTSGSTGEPKGVPVSFDNLIAYTQFFGEQFGVNPEDRFSQMHDLTFDFSVHDIFVPLFWGACICCTPRSHLMAPAKFIRDKKITMWASVPSVVGFLDRLRLLRNEAFPSIRLSMFCGEALRKDTAQAWSRAAHHSKVINFYGPTEATVAITYYEWDQKRDASYEVVPIGWPFKDQHCAIVDDNLNLVTKGNDGELILSGTQVTHGYLNDAPLTKSQYARIPALGEGIWYRTGDWVRQDEYGCLHYLGRIDQQVQILGHRVELQEIETHLKRITGDSLATVVAWPHNQTEELIAFLSEECVLSEEEILNQCFFSVPEYMVPRKIIFLPTMPLNSNRKIDRIALLNILHEQQKELAQHG